MHQRLTSAQMFWVFYLWVSGERLFV